MEKILLLLVVGALASCLILLIFVYYSGIPENLDHDENKGQLFLILAEDIEIESLIRWLKWRIFWRSSPMELVVLAKKTQKKQLDVLFRLQKDNNFLKILILKEGEELTFLMED